MLNRFVLFVVLIAIAGLSAGAQDTENSKQLDAILSELRQIRNLLATPSRQPMPTGVQPETLSVVNVEVGDSPMLGSKEAPLTIVEFTDFQCPFCSRFYTEVFPDLKKNYIDSGKARFYSMDLPLDIHQNALQAAQAGQCAGEQGQFWQMHDRMQRNPQHLELLNLIDYAQGINLDVAAFRQCLAGGKYKERILQAAREATSKGAQGTPAFVIGKSTSSGVEGRLSIGLQPYTFYEGLLMGGQ